MFSKKLTTNTLRQWGKSAYKGIHSKGGERQCLNPGMSDSHFYFPVKCTSTSFFKIMFKWYLFLLYQWLMHRE